MPRSLSTLFFTLTIPTPSAQGYMEGSRTVEDTDEWPETEHWEKFKSRLHFTVSWSLFKKAVAFLKQELIYIIVKRSSFWEQLRWKCEILIRCWEKETWRFRRLFSRVWAFADVDRLSSRVSISNRSIPNSSHN